MTFQVGFDCVEALASKSSGFLLPGTVTFFLIHIPSCCVFTNIECLSFFGLGVGEGVEVVSCVTVVVSVMTIFVVVVLLSFWASGSASLAVFLSTLDFFELKISDFLLICVTLDLADTEYDLILSLILFPSSSLSSWLFLDGLGAFSWAFCMSSCVPKVTRLLISISSSSSVSLGLSLFSFEKSLKLLELLLMFPMPRGSSITLLVGGDLLLLTIDLMAESYFLVLWPLNTRWISIAACSLTISGLDTRGVGM